MTPPLRDLFIVLDKYRWQYLLSGLLLILSILIRSLEPKILQIAVDGVISLRLENQLPSDISMDGITRFLYNFLPELTAENVGLALIFLAIMYMVISLLRGGLLFAADAIKAWTSEHIAKNLRDKVFAHIQRLPLSVFAKITRGELIQRATGDIDTVKDVIKSQVLTVVQILAIFFSSFAMMAIVDWQYALISIMITPFIGIASYWFFIKEKKVWREHEAESDLLSDIVQENLNGIRLVSAYANEKYEIDKFHQQNLRKRDAGFKHNLLHTFFWPTSDFLGFLQIAISIIAGGYFTIQGRITVGELLSFYTYITMVAWPMRQLGRVLSQMGMAIVALDRLSEIMTAERESLEGESIESLEGKIEFHKVSFTYPGSETPALKNISFQIQPGEKVAIIGPTGSGKSTLIRLLLKLYQIRQGSILLDENPLEFYSRKSIRKKVGLALQKPFLFSTTISENIAYTKPSVDRGKVKKVADMAQIGEIRDIFPKGYDTLVGEKGVTLSGGQKQRVALARTLLPEPDILILDDITSAVDTETEQAIFDALEDTLADKTTLIISHRITSIQQADRILVLKDGELIQEGTPESLADEPGYFQDILSIQTAVEREINQL
ncbi:MAG: ABC transporter ATP-binding protein [Bacteroidetes bacterium]|nr:ABC transporter ATP-binding protein [Bacteroidota bacterium]MCB0841927.1 ABC transporter ATP-binding protein [Bacteroidota bacterium]